MRTLRLSSWTLFVAAWLLVAAPAHGMHVPPWDTGHQSFEPSPGESNTDCGDNGPCKTASPVEVASGNFIHSVRLLTVPGTGPALDFVLTYNSHDLRRGPFGQGWVHPYDMRIVEVTDGTSVIAISTLGNGKRERFTRNADGSYGPPAHDSDRLIRQGNGTYLLRDKHGLVRHFSADGLLTFLLDRHGNFVTFTYDNTSFLNEITDAAGRKTRFSKNAAGRIATMVDPAGRTFSFSYSNSGFLTRITSPAADAYVFQYDADGDMTAILDPRGNRQVSVTYDAQGRVSRHVEGDETWTYAYSPDLRRTTKTDSASNRWEYLYNATGNITKITDPFNRVQTFEFDSLLNITRYTDELGRSTSYTYDARRNRTSERDANGNTMSMAYDPNFSYVSSVRGFRQQVTRASYDTRGDLTGIVTPAGHATTFTYDPKGHLVRVTDALGRNWTFDYDANGNVSKVTDPLGRATTVVFDVLGRVTSVTDPEARTTRFSYDLAGRVVRVDDPLSGATVTAYDASGNVTSVTSAKGGRTTFGYDPLNRMIRMTAVAQSTTYTYDARGRLATKRDGKGQTIRYTYDTLDRLTEMSMPGDTVRYTYDAVGNLLSATDTDSSVTFAYDALDRVVRASTGATTGRPATAIQYAYDEDGNRVSMIDPAGGVTGYAYDSMSQLASITDPAGSVYAFTYDALSRRTAVARPAGLSTSYTYDAAGQLTSLVHSGGPGTLSLAYTYNGVGNRLTMADNAGTHAYTYDALDRLTIATHPNASRETFAYDAVGNRTSSHISPSYTYNAATNRLTADSKYDYVYDDNGNVTERIERGTTRRMRYGYDAENRLIQVISPDNSIFQYRYDALGRRIAKAVGNAATEYVYDGMAIVAEYNNSTVSARYTAGPVIDEMLSVTRGTATSYFQTDALGSVRRAVNSTTAVSTYTYDSFGRATESGRVSPFRFQGREFDDESGLYYFRARHYDPEVGRFISEDPIGLEGGINLYTFVENNPLNFIDPSGEIPLIGIVVTGIIGGLTGGAIEYGSQMAYQYWNDGEFRSECIDWNDVKKSAAVGAATGALFGLVGPAGPLFGRAKYGGGFGRGGIFNRGDERVGWYWHKATQRNRFGFHTDDVHHQFSRIPTLPAGRGAGPLGTTAGASGAGGIADAPQKPCGCD
jgi:RHS repeat-associated protein